MAQARWGAAAALLPDGKILVVGGLSTGHHDSALKSAELYDPATNAWTALPDMADERAGAAASVLSSRQVAVMGGCGVGGETWKECEAFDPAKRTWEPLPEMAEAGRPVVDRRRVRGRGVAPVPGGMVVMGREAAELFDEEIGRWVTLPHPMGQPRVRGAQLVSLPASALQATAGEAGE